MLQSFETMYVIYKDMDATHGPYQNSALTLKTFGIKM